MKIKFVTFSEEIPKVGDVNAANLVTGAIHRQSVNYVVVMALDQHTIFATVKQDNAFVENVIQAINAMNAKWV